MRHKITNGCDLVRPGSTRFATHFLTIGSFIEHKHALKKMFVPKAFSSSMPFVFHEIQKTRGDKSTTWHKRIKAQVVSWDYW